VDVDARSNSKELDASLALGRLVCRSFRLSRRVCRRSRVVRLPRASRRDSKKLRRPKPRLAWLNPFPLVQTGPALIVEVLGDEEEEKEPVTVVSVSRREEKRS